MIITGIVQRRHPMSKRQKYRSLAFHACRRSNSDLPSAHAGSASQIRIPMLFKFPTIAGLAEAICAPLGIEPPIYRRRVDFFTKSRAFDISRARAELGYSPRIGLREGIGRTLQWYRQAGWI